RSCARAVSASAPQFTDWTVIPGAPRGHTLCGTGPRDVRPSLWVNLGCKVIGVFWLALAGAAPAAAQQAPTPAPSGPGAGAWAPGPAASGDRNALAGVIDVPASGASVPTGNLQLSG